MLLWACKSSEGVRERRQRLKVEQDVGDAGTAGMGGSKKPSIAEIRGAGREQPESVRQQTRNVLPLPPCQGRGWPGQSDML